MRHSHDQLPQSPDSRNPPATAWKALRSLPSSLGPCIMRVAWRKGRGGTPLTVLSLSDCCAVLCVLATLPGTNTKSTAGAVHAYWYRCTPLPVLLSTQDCQMHFATLTVTRLPNAWRVRAGQLHGQGRSSERHRREGRRRLQLQFRTAEKR